MTTKDELAELKRLAGEKREQQRIDLEAAKLRKELEQGTVIGYSKRYIKRILKRLFL